MYGERAFVFLCVCWQLSQLAMQERFDPDQEIDRHCHDPPDGGADEGTVATTTTT